MVFSSPFLFLFDFIKRKTKIYNCNYNANDSILFRCQVFDIKKSEKNKIKKAAKKEFKKNLKIAQKAEDEYNKVYRFGLWRRRQK